MNRKTGFTGTQGVILYSICLWGVWWFWGRNPSISIDHPSDPILVNCSPRWNGKECRGLKWVSDLPKAILEDNPDAKGWWYVIHQTVPDRELPEMPSVDDTEAWSKYQNYWKWKPINYPPTKEFLMDNL